MASLTHNALLSSLKDLRQCDESLTLLVKRTILDPFQPDLQHPDSGPHHTVPNHNDKRLEATRLAPLAMSIVNQNIQSLKSFKEWIRLDANNEIDPAARTKWINSIKGCLIDTSFDSIAALKLMNVYLPLKPLDIEKTTSNLICKLADLGEWTRTLDELVNFRQHLADLGGVLSDKDLSFNLANASTKHTCNGAQGRNGDEPPVYSSYSDEIPFLYDNDLKTQTSDKQQRPTRHDHSSPAHSPLNLVVNICCCCHPPVPTPWEESMLNKYSDLFTFSLDADLNERSTILLVLAYQMNAIRSWCGINGGSMIKYLVVLVNRPGNFIDWCNRLMPYDNVIAKKQLDLLERHMTKTANKASKVNDDPLMITAIRAFALLSAGCSNLHPLQSICDAFISLGSNYEKSTTKVKYNHLETFCSDMMQALHPLSEQPLDLKAYLGLCEYHAYVSHKAKIYPGALSSYISIIKLLDIIFNEMTTTPTCYYTAFDALVKLSLCTLQMDAMTLGESSDVDLQTLLLDVSSSVDAVIQVVKIDDIYNNERTEWVLEKLGKSIRGFWQCSNRFWEMVRQKDKAKAFDRPSILQSPESSSLSEMEQYMEGISSALQGCHELLRLKMLLLKKLEHFGDESTSTLCLPDMLLTYVHIMIVLARIQFDAKNDNAYHRSFEYLDTAEQLCSDYEFSSGYRGISAAYYSLGTEMVKKNLLSKAVYPLRKACSILESNFGKSTVDADRLQLAKRYETLGVCFQKDGNYKGAVKAYRMALKYLPGTTLDLFTADSNRLALTKLIERHPLAPRLVDRFIRASFSDHECQSSYATELMDLSALSTIQKCVLYECELGVLLTLSPRLNLVAQQGWIINSLLQNYSAEQYPIRRSRTLLSKIRMLYTKGFADDESIRSAIQYVLEAQRLLKSKNFGLDDNLQGYYRHYLALTYFWLGILRRELDETALDLYSSALHHWHSLLEGIEPLSRPDSTLKVDLEHVCLLIDDLDGLYNHLNVLSDLLGLIGQPYLQINTLRLLLKINNGLRESAADCYSDSVIITANIGRIYTELGYSGKADVEFSKVEDILARYPCSNQAELHFLIQHCHYLSRMGDYDKSQAIFNAARVLWDKNEQLDNSSLESLGSIKQQALKYLMASDCYLARSSISLHKESLDAAISDAACSYRVINNFMEYINKQTRSDPDEHDIYKSKDINFGTDQNLNQRLNTASALVFNEYQWTAAMKLGACIEQLVTLHMTRGTWGDAQYYLLQGIQLGEQVKSNAMVYRFLLGLSDSYLRAGQLEKSKSSLDSAIAIHAKGPTHLWEDALLTSASGNLDAHRDLLHEALESYDTVDKLLLRMMDPDYINQLETLPESDQDLSCDAVRVDLEDTQYTCQILQAKQDENATLRLMVMTKIGLMSSGLKILEQIEQSVNTSSNRNLLKATSAHIRLMIAKDELMDYANLTYMESSVLGSTFALLRSRGNGFIGTSHSTRMICERLEQLLNCILDTIKKCSRIETVALVEQLYLDAGSTMFLKNQLSNTDTYYASMSSYYFEMAKSIGIRREMQSCLDQKLLIPTTTIEDFWPKQIPDLDSKDNNSIRISSSTHLTTLRELYQQDYDLDGREFSSTLIDILPPHWTVCSLSLNVDDQVLYVTRYRAGEPPLVLRLPLDRAGKLCQSKYPGKVGISYPQAVGEFKNIMDLYNETMHPTGERNVEDWWMDRVRLDTRLKTLLEDMERSWLGGFKGLFTGRYYISVEALDTFRTQLVDILTTNITGYSKALPISDSILHLILHLGADDPNDHELADVISFLLTGMQQPLVDYSDMDRIVRLIRPICRASGITSHLLPDEHLILIPDQHTHFLPLESLPTLRSQSVSRLPCLAFLRDRILSRSHYTINRSNTYYVLDPTNDLDETRAKFEPIFARMPSWEGCIGTTPSEIECRSMLMEKDVYFGRRSLIRGKTIRQLPKCAVGLLMGCPQGTFDYLLAGSLAVLTPLWSMTDKSVQQTSQQILDRWGLVGQQTNRSLVDALASCRDQCQFPYLVGASFVVYGVPVYVV